MGLIDPDGMEPGEPPVIIFRIYKNERLYSFLNDDAVFQKKTRLLK